MGGIGRNLIPPNRVRLEAAAAQLSRHCAARLRTIGFVQILRLLKLNDPAVTNMIQHHHHDSRLCQWLCQ